MNLRIRKLAVALAVLAVALAFAQDLSQGRIEQLSSEDINSHTWAKFFHDKESGIEIVCIYGVTSVNGFGHPTENAISCLPTGRTWKK